MRFGNFESTGQELLGEGADRKTFINPVDAEKVISATKEGAEKDTHRQLKGRFYLTKIVHALLPKNIPNVYQVGESRDGIQSADRQRISHTTGHAHLQKARQSGGSEESARKQIIEEMGGKE